MQGAPKYDKIELTWKNDDISTFENCGMVVTADKIIIVTDTNDSIQNVMKSHGQIFELSELKEYKTYRVKQHHGEDIINPQ